MEESQEIDAEGLKKEAKEFNRKMELDKLNKLIDIDQRGSLNNSKRTSTIDIPGTRANREARDLGFKVIPKTNATPLKTGK